MSATLFAASPALANWEATRWGMTPAQVKALYPAAREVPGASAADGVTLTVDQPVASRWLTWKVVSFRFDAAGHLTGVTLTPPDGSRDHLEDFLIFTYGAPTALEGSLEQTGRTNASYRADYLSRETGDRAVFSAVTFMGVSIKSVRIDRPDPAAAARRTAMQRLKTMRDAGLAPRPGGGWNNTHWTMSREDVLALYPTVRLDELGRLRLDSPLQWQGRTWSAMAFDFDADYGLSSVTLWVDPGEVHALDAQARQWFGPPAHSYGDPTGAPIPIYSLTFAPTAAGETIELFSLALAGESGVGLRLYAPDDSAALRAAAAAPDPGPGRPELHLTMTLAEFKRLFPAATATAADGQFWAVTAPSLYGRTWKRGMFNFTYGDLDEFTLFSNDSFDAIAASMTSLYGPPQIQQVGGFTESWFEDNPNRASYRLRRMFDGTAMLKVMQKVV